MTILILDDDFFVRKNMINGIDWAALHIDTVLECDNGRDAIRLCGQRRIDLIISDICMPGLNGIECIRQISSFCPGIRFLFISAYPEKEYLKDIIRLHAVSFLEKPIIMDELASVLRTQISEMEQELLRDSQIREASSLHSRQNGIRLARQLSDPASDPGALLHTAMESGFWQQDASYLAVMISFSKNFYDAMEPDFTEYFYNACEARLDDRIRMIACFHRHNLSVWLSGPFLQRAIQLTKQLKPLLLSVLEEHLLPADVRFRIGIGNIVSSFSMLKDTYRQACIALQKAFFLPEGCCYFYQDIISEEAPFPFTPDLLNDWRQYLLDDRLSDVADQLELLYARLQTKSNTLPSVICHFYCETAELLSEWCSRHGLSCFTDFENKYLLFEELSGFLYLRELHAFLMEHLRRLMAVESSWNYGNETVNRIARYISLHYSDPDLSLSEISEDVHMAQNYIVGLFKKYTSMTINHYIADHRIAIAKNLLRTTEKSVSDIAKETGFRNGGYFSKVFYKHTRLTPNEYRRTGTST